MRARRDFRHDTSVGRMVVDLAQHFIGKELRARSFNLAYDRDGCFVATGLNTHDGERGHDFSFPFHFF